MATRARTVVTLFGGQGPSMDYRGDSPFCVRRVVGHDHARAWETYWIDFKNSTWWSNVNAAVDVSQASRASNDGAYQIGMFMSTQLADLASLRTIYALGCAALRFDAICADVGTNQTRHQGSEVGRCACTADRPHCLERWPRRLSE